jgi:RimJ/RimL family protein N-acetyltransferase
VIRWPGAAVELAGRRVVLEPLREAHAAELWAAAQDPRIWQWLPENPAASPAAFGRWFGQASDALRLGEEAPFAVRADGTVVGSTRYLSIERAQLRLEVGWTWYAPAVWGTGVNAEAKLLLLRHAFETLGARRVEFKTDARNERSRGALTALGAQFEGVFRKHMVLPDGGARDSAYYAIVDDEWPAVRARLEARLARY